MGERDLILRLVKLFKKHKITYLLTGSLAVSFWGRPRATHDIDFVVEIPLRQRTKLNALLHGIGNDFIIDTAQADEAIKLASQFNIIHMETGIKVDFWMVKNNEFEKIKLQRRTEVKLFGEKIAIVSAEDLILTKLYLSKDLFSERHLRDCIGIWQIQKDSLDKKYLRSWAVKLGVTNLYQKVQNGEY